MSDRNMGEMFHNFQLHPNTVGFTAIDLAPLGLNKEDYPHRWVQWDRTLMGFKSSPYNCVRMYLVAEEIIRGDRRDSNNAFQWESIKLNLPGGTGYDPGRPWIGKFRADNSRASDWVTFVDDQRLVAQGSDRMREASHALSTREAYVGLQDALRKARCVDGSKQPGSWAGVNVVIEDNGSVAVTASQEKWDRMKAICNYWLDLLDEGMVDLDHKKLSSDRGFMVYAVQAFPAMKPYLKGFHLSLEMWRGGRDGEGWKIKKGNTMNAREYEEDFHSCQTEGWSEMTSAVWCQSFNNQDGGGDEVLHAPANGLTQAVPRFKADLEALLKLTAAPSPALRKVRRGKPCIAIYGFGDASGAGFGATIDRPDIGLVGRFGLWGRDAEDESSNYRELRNLVETVENEARSGVLEGNEMWLFTDNSTAESCFTRGDSKSLKLHELVLRLRMVEMEHSFSLNVVHVAGTRMIAQGTDGVSRGAFSEGVTVGNHMSAYIDLAYGAAQRHPPVIEFIKSSSNLLSRLQRCWG